jgi:hypothetical protein
MASWRAAGSTPFSLRSVVAIATFGAALVLPQSAVARDIFVSSAGTDSAPGTAAQPVRTINRALDIARDGDTVQVRPGTYAQIKTARRHDKTPVTVRGAGATAPSVAGARILGASGLNFNSINFTDEVMIARNGKSHVGSESIQLRRCDLTNRNGNALTVRDGASHILVTDNYVHDSLNGIEGPGGKARTSSDISIQDNLLERFTSDGIRFGHWRNVLIAGNVVRQMHDPRGQIHNDGVQIFGDVDNLEITDNVISQSDGQLVLIQDNVGGINDGILVENNLIVDAGAAAMQIQGTRRFRLQANTIWGSAYGIYLRRGHTGMVMTDAVLKNNVIDKLLLLDGIKPKFNDYNFVGASRSPKGAHEIRGGDPGFAHPEQGDYHPRSNARIVGRGDPNGSPSKDMEGRRRPSKPAIGSLEPWVGGGTGTGTPTFVPVPVTLPGAHPPVSTTSTPITGPIHTTVPVSLPGLPPPSVPTPVTPQVPVPSPPPTPAPPPLPVKVTPPSPPPLPVKPPPRP